MKANQYVDILVDKREYAVMIEERSALGHLVSPCIPMLKYMSDDAIVQWILTACEMVEEANDGKDHSIDRKVNSLRSYLDTYMKGKKHSNLSLQQILVNLYLSSMDMGLLPGFKSGKVNARGQVSRSNANPELISARDKK